MPSSSSYTRCASWHISFIQERCKQTYEFNLAIGCNQVRLFVRVVSFDVTHRLLEFIMCLASCGLKFEDSLGHDRQLLATSLQCLKRVRSKIPTRCTHILQLVDLSSRLQYFISPFLLNLLELFFVFLDLRVNLSTEIVEVLISAVEFEL